MSLTDTIPQPAAARIGEEALATVQRAVQEALIEYRKAGQLLSIWHGGRVVCPNVDEA